jgi:23S rRNA-/tRNA-specific pseudouridylate synthase
MRLCRPRWLSGISMNKNDRELSKAIQDDIDTKKIKLEKPDERASVHPTALEFPSQTDPIIHAWRGFRIIEPYYYCYRTFVKGRWLGKTLAEMFCSEFRDRHPLYYSEAVSRGNILYNAERITLDLFKTSVLKQNDTVQHLVHRHEPLVPDTDIALIHLNKEDGLLVVNKPAGLPCHPSGKYFFNSINEVLKRQYGKALLDATVPAHLRQPPCDKGDILDPIAKSRLASAQKKYSQQYEAYMKKKEEIILSNIQRLDRLTSGVLLLSFKKTHAQMLHARMSDRLFQKTYLARVQGRFDPLMLLKRFPKDLTAVNPTQIACEAPVYVADHKSSLCSVAPTSFQILSEAPQEKGAAMDLVGLTDSYGYARSAVTHIKLIAYDAESDQSLLCCEPLTGRTHQIRIHLQFLGHPICHDPIYGHPALWQHLTRDSDGRFYHKDLLQVAKKYLEDILPPSRPLFIEQGPLLFESAMQELQNCDTIQNLVDRKYLQSLLNLPKWFDRDCDECRRQWFRSFQSLASTHFIRSSHIKEYPTLTTIINAIDDSLETIDFFIPLEVPLDNSYQLAEPMCLHAVRYASVDPKDPWSFESLSPSWAT